MSRRHLSNGTRTTSSRVEADVSVRWWDGTTASTGNRSVRGSGRPVRRARPGDNLSADDVRIVWDIDDTTARSEPTDVEQELLAGTSTTFTFDGATSADGTWSSYPSPGTVDIRADDRITVTLYDTDSNKPVVERTVTAGDVTADLSTGSTGSGLVFAHDTSPGANTVHELNWDVEASDSAAGSSLNNVEIRYPAGVDFPDVDSRSDVIAAGIDEDGDGTVDDPATVECCPSDSDGDGDVDGDGVYQGYSGDQNTLRIEFQGNADVDPGETMILEIEGVDNPGSSGSYTVDIGIDGAQTETGTLEVG
jgi:hypothetical protein